MRSSSQQQGPNPRFGMLAPQTESSTVQTPSGLTATVTHSSAVELSNPNDPLSLVSLSDSTSVNGNTTTSVFTAADLSVTDTSPEGRIQPPG